MLACVEAAGLRGSLRLRHVLRTSRTVNLKTKVKRTHADRRKKWQAPRPMIQSRLTQRCSRMLHHNLVVTSVNNCLMDQTYSYIPETIVMRCV